MEYFDNWSSRFFDTSKNLYKGDMYVSKEKEKKHEDVLRDVIRALFGCDEDNSSYLHHNINSRLLNSRVSDFHLKLITKCLCFSTSFYTNKIHYETTWSKLIRSRKSFRLLSSDWEIELENFLNSFFKIDLEKFYNYFHLNNKDLFYLGSIKVEFDKLSSYEKKIIQVINGEKLQLVDFIDKETGFENSSKLISIVLVKFPEEYCKLQTLIDETLIECDPISKIRILNSTALVHIKSNDFKSATICLDAVSQIIEAFDNTKLKNQLSGINYYHRSVISRIKEEIDLEVQFLNKANELDVDFFDYNYRLAQIYHDRKDSSCINYYEKALSSTPFDRSISHDLGCAYNDFSSEKLPSFEAVYECII